MNSQHSWRNLRANWAEQRWFRCRLDAQASQQQEGVLQLDIKAQRKSPEETEYHLFIHQLWNNHSQTSTIFNQFRTHPRMLQEMKPFIMKNQREIQLHWKLWIDTPYKGVLNAHFGDIYWLRDFKQFATILVNSRVRFLHMSRAQEYLNRWNVKKNGAVSMDLQSWTNRCMTFSQVRKQLLLKCPN